MNRHCVLGVISVIGVVLGIGATPRGGERQALPDGVYFGNVRQLPSAQQTVAVDFVRLPGGKIDHNPNEVVIYAGPLAEAGILIARPKRFQIIIKDGSIVGLSAADRMDITP